MAYADGNEILFSPKINIIAVGGDATDKNLKVYNIDEFEFDGNACTNFKGNKYVGTLLNGCIIPYSNNGVVIDTIRGAEINPDTTGFFNSNFTGYDMIVLPKNITNISSGCFNESTIKEIIIEADKVIICGDEANRGRVFRNCRELTTLDTAKLDLSENTTTITTMFQSCEQLPNIDINHWDTSRITNMSYLFNSCASITTLDLSNWDTRNVLDMKSVFAKCTSLIDLNVNNWDTSNVLNMASVFTDCNKITTLDLSNWDTRNVTNMAFLFSGCRSITTLNLSNFDTSKVTTMKAMFQAMDSLSSIDVSNFNTSEVTDMSSMFAFDSKLPNLNISSFDTSKVETMQNMFYSTPKLTTINGNINMVNVTNATAMFGACTSLIVVTLKNIRISLQLSNSYKLAKSTVINTVKELWDLTGETSQTLTLHNETKNNFMGNVYVKLIPVTDEMRMADEYIDNKKPCEECESTDEGAMTLVEYAISKNWAIA